MKKIVSTIGILLAVTVFTLSAIASNDLVWGTNTAFDDIDEDFTIAVITDTSAIAAYPDLLNDMTEWIAANKTTENIKCVVKMGNTISMANALQYWTKLDVYGYDYGYLADGFIKDQISSTQAQNFVSSLETLYSAGIPYLIAPGTAEYMGNYDRTYYLSYYLDPQKFSATGYSTKIYRSNLKNPVTNESVPDISSLLGAYYTFTAGGEEFLVMTIEAWPTSYARQWVYNILDANTDKKVIVSVSSYLDKEGVLKPCWPLPLPTEFPLVYNGVTCERLADYRRLFDNPMSPKNISNFYAPIDGITIWNEIFAKYSNIILALDGGVQKISTPSNTLSANRLITNIARRDDSSLMLTVQANYDDLCQETGTLLLIKFYNNAEKADFAVYSPTYDAYVQGESHKYSVDFPNLKFPIASGKVIIQGTPVCDNTITASVVALEPEDAEYTLQWKIDGDIIATGSSFTLKESHIGKLIEVCAVGTGDYGGQADRAYIVPRKANASAPSAPPVLSEKTIGSITVQAEDGYEYRLGNGDWQQSGRFDGLRANTAYDIYSRLAQTNTHFASPPSPSLAVVTEALPEKADIILGDTNGDGKITITDISLLRRHIAGWPLAISTVAANIDGNSSVTADDHALFTRYFTGWTTAYNIGGAVDTAVPPTDAEYGDQDEVWPWYKDTEN